MTTPEQALHERREDRRCALAAAANLVALGAFADTEDQVVEATTSLAEQLLGWLA